jgi:hypothetical protein
MSADTDPMAAYLTYLADVTGGAVGNMGFTADDFESQISELRKRLRWAAATRVFETRIPSACPTRALLDHIL